MSWVVLAKKFDLYFMEKLSNYINFFESECDYDFLLMESS
jgi:hypothetical protein